ncbi:MAG: ATP-binding protein [Acidobacteriota bacterium]|nr:ATP-binding protein [Acidobacteriota bacterium]
MAPQGQQEQIEELTWLKARVAELERLAAERRETALALEESRRLFDSFLSHTPAIAWMKDERGRYVFANRRFHDAVSESGTTCIGSTDDELWEPPVAARVRANDLAMRDQVERLPFAGVERQYIVHRFPFRTGNGRRYIGGIGVDISGERSARAQLFQSALNGVMECCGDRIVDANETLLSWLGYSRQEGAAAPLNWRSMTPPQYWERDAEALAELHATGSWKPYEKEFLDRNGNPVPVMVGGCGTGADHDSFICFVLNISERRQMEARLLRSQKLESLGLIAGGVAHDFNNLLATIMGNASLSLDAISREHPAYHPLNEVVIASKRASDLTQQVLAYSGRAHIAIKAVDLSMAVREIGSLLETTISKKIELKFELADRLPTIDGDEGQLQQVIMNLVINASDAIGEKEGQILVRTREAHGVCFEVRDTGCGMDEATKNRIFDPFFTTKANGRGLGLAAVLGIVRNHGGTLLVESEAGAGTTFRIIFPAGKVQAVRRPAVAASTDLGGTETILVADDDEGIRRMTRLALERLGYKVLLAENGKDAVEVFRRHQKEIAVVLIDWAMPVMNGEEALSRIFAIDPHAKAVMSSGYAETDRLQQVGTPLAAFVQKPYTTTSLARTLRTVIDTDRDTDHDDSEEVSEAPAERRGQ